MTTTAPSSPGSAAASAGGADAHAHDHPEPNYMGIWVALLVLTILEVGVTYTPIGRSLMILSLILMALAKAGLVAAYFMHLKFERWVLVGVVLSPLILSGILGVALMPDSLTHLPDFLPIKR
jgi:cytochrome c oxidase subunit 4